MSGLRATDRLAPGRGRRSRGVLLASALAVVLWPATPATGAPGDVDESFGRHGFARVQLSGGNEAVEALAANAEGKLVAVGTTTGIGEDYFPEVAVGMLNRAGKPDQDFAADGRLQFRFGGANPLAGEFGTGVALAPDGKILVTGAGLSNGFNVARLNPDGSFDPTFAGDGTLTVDLPGAPQANAFAIAVLVDGRIVVAGDSGPPNAKDAVIARFLTDGTLDPSFSENGVATLGTQASESFGDLAIAADGTIVVAGYMSAGARSTRPLLARYLPNGAPDDSFSADGMLTDAVDTDLGSVAIDPAGRIVASGHQLAQPGVFDGIRALAVRFTAAGDRDPTFSSDGAARINFPGYDSKSTDLLSGADGTLTVLAEISRSEGNWSDTDYALARLGLDGQPSTAFGRGGKVIADLGCESGEVPRALAQQADGKLVAAGGCQFEVVRDEIYDGALSFARFEAGPGPGDADADGVRNANDRCPFAFGPRSARGCGRVRRELIETRYGDGKIRGLIESDDGDCEYRQEVQLFRVRGGGNRPVDREQTTGDAFSFSVKRGTGTYSVQVKRRRDRAAGFCNAAEAIVKS